VTLEDTGLTEEQVMSVRDRSLEEAYADHDVGMVHLKARLQAHGFTVEDHGDDARHADEVYMGDGPDLKVFTPDGELVAYIELKVKTSQEWFARCNRRHYNEYVNFTNEVTEPVFIWFALVDSETEQLHRSAFFEVEDTDQIDGEVVDVRNHKLIFREDDLMEVDGGGDHHTYLAVTGDDLIEKDPRPKDEIAGFIPNVHGNDVVCLNEDGLRSMPHFLHRVA